MYRWCEGGEWEGRREEGEEDGRKIWLKEEDGKDG